MNNAYRTAVAFSLAAAAAWVTAAAGTSRPPEPSLCELVANAVKHHGEKVQVRAILVLGPEYQALYDPACQGGRLVTDVEYSVARKAMPKGLVEILARDRRAWVVLDGVLNGPVPLQVDQNIQPKIREALSKDHQRYGHLGMFDTMLLVKKVRSFSSVEMGVPQWRR